MMKKINQYKKDIKILMKKSSDIDIKRRMEGRIRLTKAELKLKNEILDLVEKLMKEIK
jgi:hypothetical protein